MSKVGPSTLLPALADYIEECHAESATIPTSRRDILQAIAASCAEMWQADGRIILLFVCTHNSRRSQLAQLWAHVAGYLQTGGSVWQCHSAGTEATAVAKPILQSLQACGFQVREKNGPRQEVEIDYATEEEPLVLYSKSIDDALLPKDQFIVVTTCGDADANCPYVPGTKKRFHLPYEDPKQSDGSSSQAATYAHRCRQIAVEMLLLSQMATAKYKSLA
jgi:arsenate reductase